MEELGDWVYIILMVVVGISSLYSSAKKKQKQQQMQMPTPVSDPSDQYEMPDPTPSVPNKIERKQPPTFQKKMKRQPFNTYSTIPPVETFAQIEKNLLQEEENTIASNLELTDADSFRKAVIYAEILNRKY